MFDRSALCVRRSLPFARAFFVALTLLVLKTSLCAQGLTEENPTLGTIQGTVRDEDGSPIQNARISYSSQATDTRGVTRAGKDGSYVTETLSPGLYVVRVDGRDFLPSESNITVIAGTPVTANFQLGRTNPGPVRLESHFSGDLPDNLPINGRNYLAPGELFPGVQAVDGAIYDPGKTGFQSLSILSRLGRTTRFDEDEVEIMDETKGAATMTLPTDAVRDVVISRVLPEVFQSLNAAGAVRITTRSATTGEWHGDVFGNLRDQFLGLAGFPGGDSDYSRQQYGFGAGGAVIKDKGFLFVSGERTKQDGALPTQLGFPGPNQTSRRSAYFRENMLFARFDYNLNDNTKFFARLGYDNANQIGPQDSLSSFRNQINVPSLGVGLDWNRGRFVHSARFGYQKMVNALNPALGDSLIDPNAPFHVQLGSYSEGPSNVGPRQTIQRDLYGRYDSSTLYRSIHNLRFGGAVHRIVQGDFYNPANFGPTVTSSDGLDVISAINGNPSSPFPGGANNPLNYPVGTITIYNGLGNFSENSVFNRPNGGHSDTRFEGYIGDTFKPINNVNVSLGVNYVFSTGRLDADIAPIPCSAINTSIVLSPPCAGGLPILDQFGLAPPFGTSLPLDLGQQVTRPYKDFAPQLGVAWDPGHNGRTVIRASGGMFFDNFLLQNLNQDRINRLSSGQYNRSLTLCPTGSILFPDSAAINAPDIVSSVDGLNIATQICGQPIGSVAGAIQDLQANFQANQASVAGGPNVYSLANSVADFGGMIAPGFKTPRVVHISAGIERQMGQRSMFSVDYVRELGSQFPLGIDTNHVGDSQFMTDGSNPNPALNTYAAEFSAINATVAPFGCGPATVTGGGPNGSVTAVNCYLSQVNNASIADFARNGLDSSNAFCGPFPCSVLGKPQAAFGGINPAVGSNVMYLPSGRSIYQGLHIVYHTSSAVDAIRRVRKLDVSTSYTWSRYRSNIAEPNGSGGDYSMLNIAEDYNRPHLGHLGASGMDRTHQLVITPTVETPRGLRISMIAFLASPLPLSAYLPQMDGGGVAGEIFRTDWTGDGTVGDLLPGSRIGTTGRYSSGKLNNAISFYNKNLAQQLTPAGQDLVGAALFTVQQLHELGALTPLVSSCNPPTATCGLPGRPAQPTWFKSVDLRFSWPYALTERVKIEPSFYVFNVLNLANFGGPGGQLNGILNGAPGTSLNNATSPGVCGISTSYCTSRLDRILPGSGTFGNGAPRQLQFGVRVTF